MGERGAAKVEIKDMIPLVIIAIVAAGRTAGLPTKLSPIFALVLGVIAGVWVMPSLGVPFPHSIVAGLYSAAAAVGLVSSAKNTLEAMGVVRGEK